MNDLGQEPDDLAEDETGWQQLVYKENAKVIATFWEWRHKGMTYFSAGVTALVALAGWSFKQGEFLRRISFVPLAAGGAFALLSLFLDVRNARILKHCYGVGAAIERQRQVQRILKDATIFTFLERGQISWFSYTRGLQAFYIVSAFLLFGVAWLLFKNA